MTAVDRLRRDHTLLRGKLDVLETALGMGPETWYVVREVCFTLSRQLRDHIRREEALVEACRQQLDPRVLAEVAVEHRDEPAHLRAINRLFVAGAGGLDQLRPALTDVLRGLRRHMAEEEAELFPACERVLAGTQEGAGMPSAGTRRLNEEMTVNRVVREFPRTRPVFERLFINVPLEGSTCLDEVAWRHGVEARDLLQTLEDVIEPS